MAGTRWSSTALLLLVLVAAGCGGHGLSAADKQYAETLGSVALAAGDLLAPIDACSDEPCLRRTGAAAAAKLGAKVALVERGLPAVEADCLRGSAATLRRGLRAYLAAAQQAAQGRNGSLPRSEARGESLTFRSLELILACMPGSGQTTVVVHALGAIAQGFDRVDSCTDAACRTAGAARLSRLLDEQRQLIDRAFGAKSECALQARSEFDEAFAALQRAASAVANDDEAAAESAIRAAGELLDQGRQTAENCVS